MNAALAELLAMYPDPRGTRRWRDLAVRLVQPGAVCWLCGKPIVFGLRPRHRLGPSLDHRIPYVRRPDLALVLSNLAPAHLGCNASKGARPAAQPPRDPDDW